MKGRKPVRPDGKKSEKKYVKVTKSLSLGSAKVMKLQSRFFVSNTKELEKQFGKGEKLRLQTHLSVYKGKGVGTESRQLWI